MGLSERDRAILEFEAGCWRYEGTKDAAIRARLDLSPTRYYGILGILVDDADALAHDPLLVRRLRRVRAQRRRARYEGRSAGEGHRR